MTTGITRTAPWLIQIERQAPLVARRRRWAKALKALGVVILLAAIAT
jgi:hypothetical protein